MNGAAEARIQTPLGFWSVAIVWRQKLYAFYAATWKARIHV